MNLLFQTIIFAECVAVQFKYHQVFIFTLQNSPLFALHIIINLKSIVHRPRRKRPCLGTIAWYYFWLNVIQILSINILAKLDVNWCMAYLKEYLPNKVNWKSVLLQYIMFRYLKESGLRYFQYFDSNNHWSSIGVYAGG